MLLRVAMVRFGLISPKVGSISDKIAMRIYSTRIKSEENTVTENISAVQTGSQKDFLNERLVVRSRQQAGIL